MNEKEFIIQAGYVADFESHEDKLVAASHAKFFDAYVYRYAKTIALPSNIKWHANEPSFIYQGDILRTMLDDIAKDKADVIFVYFHNLKNFDGHFIIPWLITNNCAHTIERAPQADQFTSIEVMGSILSININYKGKTIRFLDSAAQLPMTLEAAAKMFAPNELKLKPQELLASLNINIADEDEAKKIFYAIDPKSVEGAMFDIYKDYTKQDVRALAATLTNYMTGSNTYIPKAITASSMAIMTLRSQEPAQFEKLQLDFTAENLNWMRIAKPLYRGGYTNTMLNYEGKLFKSVRYYDINSDYPHIMTGKLPVGLPRQVSSTYKLEEDEAMFYELVITAGRLRKDHFAIIPANTTLKYAYNIDRPQHMYVYDEELEYFKKFYKGLSYRIINRYVIKLEKVISDFITTRYNKRQEIKKSQPALAHSIKLVLNSIYGKTGELWVKPVRAYVQNDREDLIKWRKERTWVFWKDQKLQEQEHGHPYILKSIKGVDYDNNIVTVELEHAIPENAIVMRKDGSPYKKLNMFVAGYITTKARCRLYQANLWALETGNKALYCDTDSIIATGKNMAAFEALMGLDEKILGRWKVEHQDVPFICAQPKRYVINNEVTAGGYSDMSFTNMSELKDGEIFMTKHFSKKTKYGKIISENASKRYFLRSENNRQVKYYYNARTGELRKEIK